jgi:fluoride exporter
MILPYVMLTGALGSGARYLVGRTFPHGTIIVNVLGCFALGAVVQLATSGDWSAEMRAAVAIGFLGGFTTYSSFNQETITMLANGRVGPAIANIAFTLVGGLAAGSLGLVAARAIAS